MATVEISRESVEELAGSDLKAACARARELVAARPDDEDAAKLLKQIVQRLAGELPPRPDPNAHLPPPLAEASRLLSADQNEPAEILLRRYLSEHRNDVRAMAMMAEIAGRCELFDNARKILDRALEIDPKSVDALLILGKLVSHLNLAQHKDRGEEALEIVERALAIAPQNADAVSLHSSILVRFRRLEESVPSYVRLLELDPMHWLAWTNFGIMLNSLGRFGESVANLRTALAINPLFGLAWWELANLKLSKIFESDIVEMEEALEQPALDPVSRSQIHFALAKAHHQNRRYAEAAEQLEKGNALKRDMHPHDVEQVAEDVAQSRRTFTPAYFERRRSMGDPSPDPIFIIGMPRSGSTLVEQILSSHSAIEGTEELFVLLRLAQELSTRGGGLPWQTVLEQCSETVVGRFGSSFLQLASHYRTSGRPFFIDKNHANWRFTGLIATILPNARIIDVRRNPMDCCYGNWSQHFESGVGFTYSQHALGRYYADYVLLMRHFESVAPGRIHRVIYDDLVDDLEAHVRAMLDYLGLPFEESCLRFFETERAILTPSAQQVRQPINRSGIGRWRSYEPWLGELTEGLGDVAVDWRE